MYNKNYENRLPLIHLLGSLYSFDKEHMNINCNSGFGEIERSWECGNGCETGENSKKDNGEMKDEMKGFYEWKKTL